MGNERSGKAFSLFSLWRQLYKNRECVFRCLIKAKRYLGQENFKALKFLAGEWVEERRLWIKEDLKKAVRLLKSVVVDVRSGRLRAECPAFLKKPGFYAAVVAGLLLVCGNFYLIQNRTVYAAYYEGKKIGTMADRQEWERCRTKVERGMEERLGQDVFLPNPITYKAQLLSRVEVDSPARVAASLEELPWMTRGVEVLVNGKAVLFVSNNEDACSLLKSIKEANYPKDSNEKLAEVKILEKISFRPRRVAVDSILTVEDASSLLLNGRVQNQKYVVKEGDSLWSIARANGLLVDDLLKANPGLSERLDVGQELKLARTEPVVNVMVTSTLVKNQAIPYEEKISPDPGLRRGQTRVVRAGENGEEEVTYRLVRQNGRLVAQEIVGRRVIKKPVAKLVAKGTGRSLASAWSRGAISRGSGSGVLSWPAGGRISSSYGYRGGEFHGGIDIAAGTGSPVCAAAGGRVVFAGWAGGYGKSVIIDHGNGLATRYAHLSRIYVSAGETVSRGETIGAVGSTGRATGPHLHFEVMVNGGRTNPYNYLR